MQHSPYIANILVLLVVALSAQSSLAEPSGLCDALERAFNDFSSLRSVDEVRSGRRLPQGYECAETYFFSNEPSRCVVRGGVQEPRAKASRWGIDFGWLHQTRKDAADQLKSLEEEMQACKRFEIDMSNVDTSEDEVEYPITYSHRNRQPQNLLVKLSVTDVAGNKSRGSFWTFVTIVGLDPD